MAGRWARLPLRRQGVPIHESRMVMIDREAIRLEARGAWPAAFSGHRGGDGGIVAVHEITDIARSTVACDVKVTVGRP
jgi:hypothetical protein